MSKLLKSKGSYWFIYTAVFIIMFILVFINFFLGEYSFINRVDGLNQQYSGFLYLHRWGQAIWNSWKTTGKFEFPIWDVNIGMGADITTTVFYYLGASPITFCAFFCPEAYLEYLYGIDIFFRIYLAGLGFSVYAEHHKLENWAVLLGSFCYCFCGFVLQKGIQHINFLLPMFFLPMILFGLDKVLERKSPFVFICFTALCAINNFYFFYMIVIAAALYVFCQLGFCADLSWKQRIKKICEIFVYGVIALLIASFAVLPFLYALLGSTRVGEEKTIPILYHISYYYNLFFGCMTNEFVDYDMRTGYAIPVIFSVFLFWCQKGEKKLKAAFAGLTMILCLPIAGSIMNGMGYVSNRWMFIYSFLLAYIFAKMIPGFMNSDRKCEIKMIWFLGIYFLISIVVPWCGIDDSGEIYRTGIYLLVFFIGIMLIKYYQIAYHWYKKWIIVAAVFSILASSYLKFFPVYGNDIVGYVKKDDALVRYTEGLSSNAFCEALDSQKLTNYRCDVSEVKEVANSFMLQKIHGVRYYYSVVVNSVNDFWRELYGNDAMEHFYDGLDNRFILESLAGVRYNLINSQNEAAVSPAMQIIGETEDGKVYENIYSLPMIYCYENYIPKEMYDAMSVTDKQEAMLYGAVMEESVLEAVQPQFSNHLINYTVESENLVEDNKYRFEGDNGKISLKLDEIPKDAEVYVILEGIKYSGLSPMDIYQDEWKEKDWGTRNVIRKAEIMYQEPSHVKIAVSMGEISKDVDYYTPKNRMYCGRDNFLCNLGYIEEGADEIALSFDNKGIYSFSSIQVVAQPIEPVMKQLRILQGNDVPDWNFGCNTMYGSINCTKDELLCITVPYTVGWQVYVDGEKQIIKKVNTAYMGLELTKGYHDIELVYELPMVKEGMWLSIVGLIGLCVSLIYYRMKKEH